MGMRALSASFAPFVLLTSADVILQVERTFAAPEENGDASNTTRDDGPPAAKKPRSKLLASSPMFQRTPLASLLFAAQAPLMSVMEEEEQHASALSPLVDLDVDLGADLGADPSDSAAISNESRSISAISTYLESLSASALDLEIRSLDGPTAEAELLPLAVAFLLHLLRSRRSFELVQAILKVFLKVHAEALVSRHEMAPLLEKLQSSQKAGWGELQDVLHDDLCLLSYMSNLAT